MSHQPANGPVAAGEFAEGGRGFGSEEQPEMRSVALMPGGPPKLSPLAAPPGGPKFGKAPPIGVSRPQGGLSGSRKSFTVTQEWTHTISSSLTWDVKGEDLELVPVDYPLERTHREIRREAPAVAKSISDALHRMSVDAQYDNEKAKAKCKTLECVKFRIRLYAGGENGQPVVVEVQRRSGSTSCFMRSCRAVLDAAEGTAAEAACNDSTAAPKLLAPPSIKSLGAMKCLQTVSVPGPTPEEEAKLAFEAAANLCKSEKHDSVILGLQSLCNLTDPLKASLKTASLVSQWLLSGHETYSTREHISAVLQVVLDDEDEELTHIFEEQKHYALLGLANALEMCAKDGCLSKENPWIESVLIPALLNSVREAASSASNAYAASRALASLLSSDSGSLRMIEENSGVELLQMAHAVGLQSHDLLARETARCLNSMKSP